MGSFFSRKKILTKKEILEGLENDIRQLTDQRQRNVYQEKSFIVYLLLLSLSSYLIGAAIFYFYYSPHSWLEYGLYSIPLVLFPIIVYLVKKLLNMYFAHKKAQYDTQLTSLRAEKRRILNEVMERETFNVARELLQKFDPHNPLLREMRERGGTPQRRQQNGGGGVRQRRPAQTPHPALRQQPHPLVTAHTVPRSSQPRPSQQQLTAPPSAAIPSAPANDAPPQEPSPPPVGPQLPTGHTSQFIPPGMCLGPAPGPPTPSPILPRDRTSLDKMVEYLVGDGPNNRYALICSSCHSHNGMALGDEFEYISFRCAYCYSLNPARRNKPSFPRQTSTSGDPPRDSADAVATETVEGSEEGVSAESVRESEDGSEQAAAAEPAEVKGHQEAEQTTD